jgi:hypothetical protein
MQLPPVFVLGLLFTVYVAAYLWLSRRGYEQADEWNCAGFYYFTPEPTDAWRAKMSAYWREQRGHPPGHPERRFWTEEEDSLTTRILVTADTNH